MQQFALACRMLWSMGMRSVAILIAIAACTTSPRDQARHTGPDARGSDATASGVFDPTTTMVEIDRSGGLLPAPGPGSTCVPLTQQYTYVIAIGVLTWSVCQAPTGSNVYSTVPGQATLTGTQAVALLTALQGLSPPPYACGSDVNETYTFTTPHGVVTVDNGACLQGDDAVMTALYGVTD
jgi:hypothetical protein